MKIQANGILFHCAIDGAENLPWLILSNSLATNLSMWDPQAATLARYFRVLRYDQRGHGQSSAPSGSYPIGTLLEDVIALMDAVGIERTHVCGVSLGGATALGLAQTYPERCERIIVCNSPCASSEAGAKQWEERCDIARREGMRALVDSTIARWFPPDAIEADPPHLARVREMIATTPVNGFIGCATALSDHDFKSGIRGTRPPVLFVGGEKDSAVHPALRGLHEALPGSRFATIAGAGHIANLDQPDPFTKAILEFLTIQ